MRIDPRLVDGAGDPRVAAFTSLTDMDLRLRVEQESGLFIAEGMLVIERCIGARLDVVSVLTAPRWLDRLESLLRADDGAAVEGGGNAGVDVYVADEATLRDITGYRVHRGALAAVRRPAEIAASHLLREPGDLLVLEDLVDPTNVGLAVRSAVAQGVEAVLLSPGCADPLYRRAVKSSMGAVLRCRWARSRDWAGDLRLASEARTVLALSPHGDLDLDEAMRREADRDVAILLGSEGPGLTPLSLGAAAHRVRIPMATPDDSLNVAAAAAVACYSRATTRTMNG